jgi:hypothetical protein
VDLSNICISTCEHDDHWLEDVTVHADALAAAVGDGKTELPYDREVVLGAMRALQAACKDPQPEKAANAKKLLTSKNVVNRLGNLLAKEDVEVVMEALRTVQVWLISLSSLSFNPYRQLALTLIGRCQAVCNNSEENRDAFWNLSMSKLCTFALNHLDNADAVQVHSSHSPKAETPLTNISLRLPRTRTSCRQ